MQVLVIAILLKIIMKRRFSIIQVGSKNTHFSLSTLRFDFLMVLIPNVCNDPYFSIV